MQQLGLDPKSKIKETSRLKELVWPDLKSRPSIESAADSATWAAFISAALLALIGFYFGYLLFVIFALIYAALGWGFCVKNRVAATTAVTLVSLNITSLIVLGIWEIGLAASRGESLILFALLQVVRSLVVPGIVGLLFLNGLRAVIAYQRLTED